MDVDNKYEFLKSSFPDAFFTVIFKQSSAVQFAGDDAYTWFDGFPERCDLVKIVRSHIIPTKKIMI